MPDEPTTADTRPPGAPFPPDAIDPELVALRPHLSGVSPVLSASVVVFCAYMMITLRADLRFARADATARVLPAVGALLTEDVEDRFVRVRAVPDRAFAAQVSVGESAIGQRILPVLGTRDRVWLYTDGNPWTAPPAYDETYTGRPRRLARLPFADELRAYVDAQPPVPRFVAVKSVRAALTGGATELIDPAGSALAITAATAVSVRHIVPGRVELVARTTADRPAEPAWTLVLANAGAIPPGAVAFTSTERAVWYRVPAPEGIDAVRAALRAHNLFAVEVRPIIDTRATTWGALTVRAAGLGIEDDVVPWSEIDAVSVAVPHRVPADAIVLLTDEQPAAYWYVVPIYIVLAAFAVLFGWAFVRAIRMMKLATP